MRARVRFKVGAGAIWNILGPSGIHWKKGPLLRAKGIRSVKLSGQNEVARCENTWKFMLKR
jgi:hypothetical protein